jgi:hypothetical protein
MSEKQQTGNTTRRRVLQTGAALSAGSLVGTGVNADDSQVAQAVQEEALACGDTLTGELTEDDQPGFRGVDYSQDEYTVAGSEGDFLSVWLTAVTEDDGSAEDGEEDQELQAVGDPYLYLLAPDGTIIAEDDDSGGDLDAAITVPGLPKTGHTVLLRPVSAREIASSTNSRSNARTRSIPSRWPVATLSQGN